MNWRLPRAMVPEYLRALDELSGLEHKDFLATAAAWWRPKLEQLEVF